MRVKSFAKVNLCLYVYETQKNGLHRVDSVVDKISLHDTIVIRPSCELHVSCDDIDEKDNLGYKIAEEFRREFNVTSGAYIKIIKRIPIQAGLGGGSSNAATIILALNKIWNLNLTNDSLLKFASKFGSDISLFLCKGICRIEETGEKVTNINTTIKLRYLIIPQRCGSSTKEVFAKYNDCSTANCDKIIDNLKSCDYLHMIANMNNDLSAAQAETDSNICKTSSIINLINDYCIKNNIATKAMLSGSGSSAFVVSNKKRDLHRVNKYLKEHNIVTIKAKTTK